MMTKPFFTISTALLFLVANLCYAQLPVVNYTTPQTYKVGLPVTPLIPTNTGGPVGAPTPVVLGSGFINPTGIAVDAVGNVYLTAITSNLVAKIPAGGGPPITLGAGFTAPKGVAVDATGNVYVTDGPVKKIPIGGGPIVEVGSGIVSSYGIAVDASGNLFVSDWSTNTIKKITPAGTTTIYASGFNLPTGVAVDAAGNVYVTDRGNNQIKKILVGGNIVVIAAGNGNPNGVAVDAKGNIYFADTNNQSIIKLPNAGGNPVSLASGLSTPAGLAVTATGILYIDDNGNQAIKKYEAGGYAIDKPLPAGLVLDAGFGIISGTPTIASAIKTYTITSTNSFGSSATTINITVNNPVKPHITYSAPPIYTVAVPIAQLTPVNTGDDVAPGGYLIMPSLPNGLLFDINTGVISGTPVGSQIATNYTVTATNLGGSGSATLKITVNLPPKPKISYNGVPVYTVNIPISPLTPANSGGNIPAGGYSISPALPPGLVFDTNTGTVSGKPFINHAATNYTVTATNLGGSGTATLNIAVNPPQKPDISYGGDHVYTNAIPISSLAPINAGGTVPAQNTVNFSPALGSDLAADLAGNIYVVSYSLKTLEKIPAGGGDPVILSVNLNNPGGVTVDALGNVYVIDYPGIKKFLPNSGGWVTLGTGFSSPSSIAIDKAGNIYVTDANAIKKISPDGNHIDILHFNGLISPQGIAIDAADNIYVTDFGDKALKKISAGTTDVTVVATGFDFPFRVALDAAGNFYVVDYNSKTIKRVAAAGGTPVTIGSVFNFPISVAVDASNNVYVADTQPGIKLITAGGYFANSPLPAGLSIDSNTGFITGTPLVTSPATNYAITAYNAGGSSTCTVNIAVNHYPLPEISYPGPQVYAVNKALIPPLSPTSSNVSPPGTYYAVPVATRLTDIEGMAMDVAGNIYVTQFNLGTVRKIPADGSPPIMIASGLNGPKGVAVDGLGNVFVVEYENNAIKKIPVGGGGIVTIASGLNSPYALAIDAANNLYVGNISNGLVQKIPAGGGTPVNIGPVFGSPTGLSVDAAGNVYVSDSGTLTIFKIPAGTNNANVLVNTSAYNIYNTNGISVDAAGNLYITSYDSSAIMELPAGGNSLISIGPGSIKPSGLAVNSKNIVYISDLGDNTVKELIPPGGFYISPSLPAGLNFDKNTGFISGTPTAASPATDYTVTAFNVGGYSSANVNIQVISIATLANLTISSGSFSPAFASATTTYTVHVPNAIASIKLTPTATADDASIKINGTAVVSGAASAGLPLNVGDNIINTVVTASDGVTTKTYKLTVTRSAAGLSTNALLSSIKISPSTPIITVTGPAYKNYTTAVPNSETSLSAISVVQDATATINVNGIVAASGAAQSVPLKVGANVITVTVMAQDGATVKNYIITATRASSSVATLANLTTSAGALNPVFATLTTAYTMHVPNATASIKLTPTATAGDATITVNGTAVLSGAASASIPLNVGDNMINTVVTASDGSTIKTYTVTVTRSAAGLSTNALLTSIKISPNTPLTTVTGPGYKNYTTSVPNSETSLSVTSVAQDVTAVISVNGTTVASGAASPAIPLAVGANVINIVVTAQDGATVKNYILTATRASSSIATLSNLTTSAGTLSPVFATLTTAYTAHVPNATASIKLTPTATAGDASIKINGTAVLSGAASASLPLAVGNNIISTVVTASDGTTTQTYTLTVTRSAAGLSTNALLTSIKINPSTTITTVSGPAYKNYTTAVPNSETSLTVTSVVQDATAGITVNGTAVASGVASPSIPLAVGSTVINIVVTAQDGATTKNYIITATRTGPVQSLVLLNESPDSLKATDGIIVHPGVSPNGDGISDYLVIDGLSAYPDNKLTIMDRSGATVFNAKNYGSKVFDGHSSINGSMQLPGTYFYLLQYNNGKENKRKTGFILLKY